MNLNRAHFDYLELLAIIEYGSLDNFISQNSLAENYFSFPEIRILNNRSIYAIGHSERQMNEILNDKDQCY